MTNAQTLYTKPQAHCPRCGSAAARFFSGAMDGEKRTGCWAAKGEHDPWHDWRAFADQRSEEYEEGFQDGYSSALASPASPPPTKRFRIMEEYGKHVRGSYEVPWSVMAAHEGQAQTNHGQTLTRLNERGGLSVHEALHLIRGVRWGRGDESARIRALSIDSADEELARAASSVSTPPTDAPTSEHTL